MSKEMVLKEWSDEGTRHFGHQVLCEDCGKILGEFHEGCCKDRPHGFATEVVHECGRDVFTAFYIEVTDEYRSK